MQKLSLVDETFDLNLTFEYKLSIQLCLDGFSFSILDTLQNKVVYLFYQELYDSKPEFIVKHLQTTYQNSDLLQLEYKHTSLFYNATKLQIIPHDLFRDDDLANYQQLAFSAVQKHHHSYAEIANTNYYLISSVPDSIYSFFKEKHPQVNLQTRAQQWFAQSEEQRNYAFVSISKRELFLALYDDKGLKSFNSFSWYSESDLLFYILGSIKNQEINLEKITLHGTVNRFSYIFHQLKSYFKNVKIAERPKELEYSYLFNKLPDARFIDLFNNFIS
ncbi:MAG: DUF3822 family protein [Mangrovibacterium sp.]